jgi:4-amino-4-deoxy-L-arabinose transferase-like glycosyltransferase
MTAITRRAIVLALVLAAAATVLYATRLGTAPRYLARDEIGFGRQAYTFATTGKDLDGNRFPLFFGEPAYHVGRDPLLIYATAALLKVFPLSDVIVRLPNALVGVLDIVLMFFVARRLFKSDALGFVAAAMLALTPAHFIHSRLAVSLLLPLPFTLLWLLCLAGFLDADNENTARRRLAAGACWLGLGVYGYLASVMLMPVYLLCTAWVAVGPAGMWSRDSIRRAVILAVAFVAPIVPLVIWELAHPTRFHEMITIYHPYAPQFGPLQGLKEMLSYFSLSVRSYNYWVNLSPSLLFFDGDASLINSTRLSGVFLWPFALLFFAGIYQMLTARRSRLSIVLLIGLLTAPLPQVLTIDVGIRRSLVLVVFSVLIGTYGVEFLLSSSRRTIVRLAAIAALVMLPFSFRHFYADYVGDYQNRAAFWFGGNIRGMSEGLISLRPSPSPIYLSNKIPYLDDYWPFYAAMNGRQDLVPDTHYYTPDEIDRVAAPSRSLLVAPSIGIPSEGSLIAHGWSAVKTVTEPSGQPVFVIYEKRN